MASSTSDLIVRLSLDTTNFESAMSKFEGQTTTLQASCTNASTGITNFKQVTAQLQTSAQTLTDKLAAQKQKVSQTEQALKLVTRQLKLSQNGFYQLGTQLENIGAKLESVGKKVSQVGQQLTTKVTTPIVALGTVCVKTFTSFDDSLKTVQATMGLVAGSSEEADRQIALLNNTAQEMGRATRYSASEAASTLNYLALAGYDADKACAALPQVLALAQAGGLDLAYASDLATDAMAALGLSMDQLSNFSDQMAVTAQKSNTSIGQLGEAILTVGGTAKNLKGGTAELNAELGILANRGIKGAEGGTHLRNVILSLTNPTDKAAAQLEKLGVSVFDSSGNMRSMNDIMMDLNRSMDGMTAEQKQNIISTIFNKTDLAAVTALLDGCGDEFYELIGYIDESEGTARQMADTMESGLGGTFRTLKSAVEGLAISFGEKLAPYIQKAVEKITSIVNWLTSLDDKTKDTTTNYYDRMQYKASVTATGAIAAGRLGVFNSAGKLILLSTAAFDVTKPILYIGTAYATGKLTQTDNSISWGTAFSLENTVSGFSGTAGATVYIKGTLNGNMFTPASGVPTTTAPITEDGYTYILLGLMSTTTAAVLAPEHPMFRYYNGSFKTISQISYEAFLTAEEAQEAIDALAVGGRNYILNSGSEVATSTAQIARYALSEPMIAGEQYTVSLTLTPMEEYAVLTMRTSEGDTILAIIDLQ